MTALFWIKLIHSLIFLVESAAILFILYSGVAGIGGPALVVAMVLVVAEVVVFVANGTRCPLTKLARELGDNTGDDFIADIFLPRGFARAIPFLCGGLAFVGFAIVMARLLLRI